MSGLFPFLRGLQLSDEFALMLLQAQILLQRLHTLYYTNLPHTLLHNILMLLQAQILLQRLHTLYYTNLPHTLLHKILMLLQAQILLQRQYTVTLLYLLFFSLTLVGGERRITYLEAKDQLCTHTLYYTRFTAHFTAQTLLLTLLQTLYYTHFTILTF